MTNAIRTLTFVALVGATRLAWGGHGFHAISTVGFGDTFTCLGQSHRDPNFIMVGTGSGKIHRSIDGGATWEEITVTPARSLFFGRERNPDPRLEYALGLPGKSPLLQNWLRSKGLYTSGINLQQLLVKKGDKSTGINWIEVDWHDENRVYVGMADGLYRSTDKGRSFARIWQGWSGTRERYISTVATDPSTPRRILIGTAQGLFTSDDNGQSFQPELDYYIRDSYIRGLYSDFESPGLIHMAMGGSSMATPDGGKTWITTYWDMWGPRSDVQWVALGPNNIRAIGTGDGVFGSWQGGEMGSWQRRGLRFIGQQVSQVLILEQANIWYALTFDAVWISYDYGGTWQKAMQTGGNESPIWMEAFQRKPEHFWLLTSRQLYRYRGVPQARSAPSETMQRHVQAIPSLHRFWKKVMQHKRLYWDDAQRARERAPWAALLPDIDVGITRYYDDSVDLLKAFPYLHFPFTYHNSYLSKSVVWDVLFNWDLSRFVFDRRELPSFGRVERNLNYYRQDLTSRVQRLYREYLSVATQLAFSPPADTLTYEFQRLRLQEIAAFFNVVSDGYWSKLTGEIP